MKRVRYVSVIVDVIRTQHYRVHRTSTVLTVVRSFDVGCRRRRYRRVRESGCTGGRKKKSLYWAESNIKSSGENTNTTQITQNDLSYTTGKSFL